MKIISIVGARPQFIKLAPLSIKIREEHHEVIVHSGQHYNQNMSDAFFKDLQIPKPAYNLGVGSGSHGAQTGKMLEGLENIFVKEAPDAVVVFGDTNTTLAGALAATKLHIPVAHVEAGLRSFNKFMPEEINRVLTDHSSDLLFTPTETAMKNLEREGLLDKAVLTGDIMFDSLRANIKIALQKSEILAKLELEPKNYFLLTLHRPYNVDAAEKLRGILEVLDDIGEKGVFPVHPRTMNVISQLDVKFRSIRLIDPVGYLDFLWLEHNALKIVTDSGGVQKEAYLSKVPCITVRPETEWVETVEDGWNQLVDYDAQKLRDAVMHFQPVHGQKQVFGNGESAAKMVQVMSDLLS